MPLRTELAGGQLTRKPQMQRTRHVKDGRFIANRRGEEICRGWQDGSCGITVRGNKCSKDNSRVHQCDKCLSTDHGSVDCTSAKEPQQSLPSQPPSVRRAKGKGKGRSN
eukprot:4389548-Amphidinium_carterae.1